MEIPNHYQTLYIRFIRFACGMTIFGLISGILFQESTRKIPFSITYPPGIHWEAIYHLAFVHGHIFLIGVLIPLAVIGMLHFGLLLGGKTVSKKVLDWGLWLYLPNSFLAVLLMLYKGYHYVISIRMGQLDFVQIDHNFFCGCHLLRQIVYGLSHTLMSVGLGILVVAIFRSLPSLKTKSN